MRTPRGARPRRATSAEWSDWRWQVRNRLRTVEEVAAALRLPGWAQNVERGLLRRFPVAVTPYYLSLARPGKANDPIARQILPAAEEGVALAGETPDPLAEDALSPVPGVVRRYPDRALIVPTSFCATHCRHCFRKRGWAGGGVALKKSELLRAVEFVRSTPAIRDVLVTGGDPLHLGPRLLAMLLTELRKVPHLEVLRVASRAPVTLPQRIDEELLALLRAVRPLWFLTHFNHRVEVTPLAASALRRLVDAGIPVQNQTVLLKGVNDTSAKQLALARALLALGVRPYYLHLPDPVAGTGHFRVPLDRAVDVVRGMFGKIAGFGIPRLVVDLPGGKGKVPVMPSFLRRRDGDDLWFESPLGGGEVLYRERAANRGDARSRPGVAGPPEPG
ncbi:MAG: KamA family radical SAM protein [Planctomycetes bacterium]|nr:KamA family radical SAM protein [Planctomycetota bacterium]